MSKEAIEKACEAASNVSNQFIDFYYQTFDSNRAALGSLYRDHSMMNWEGQLFVGAATIVEKLSSLPFQTVQHRVDTRDAQPSNDSNGLVVHVTGKLAIDNESTTLSYSQAFQLLPDGSGSYYVFNDVFRLVYG